MAALPSHMYRDPMQVAMGRERNDLGCAICRHVGVTVYKNFCTHERNETQKGFPTIGHRCRYFDEVEQ